jgi:hypothetical protein
MKKYILIIFGYSLLISPVVIKEFYFCSGNYCGIFSFVLLLIGAFLLAVLTIIFVIEKNIANAKNDPSQINQNTEPEKNSLQIFWNICLFVVSIVTPFLVFRSIAKSVSIIYSDLINGTIILIVVTSTIVSCIKNQKIKEWVLIPVILVQYTILLIYKIYS